MKVLLTGITGNLGSAVAHELMERSVTVVPCVRPERLSELVERFDDVAVCNLLTEEQITFSGEVDAIVHCAGDVHFSNAEQHNERMMLPVIAFAKERSIPLYAISTAFLYSAEMRGAYANQYETDKARAEELLVASGVPHAILRPSVLTGDSMTGELRTYTAYYQLVDAVRDAATKAAASGRILRFPRMYGYSNIVPVDQAARAIADAVEQKLVGMHYITNPEPPEAQWLLEETLRFFNLSIEIVDLTPAEYATFDLSEEEQVIVRIANHFGPYWSVEHTFPESLCTESLIDRAYVERTLSAYAAAK